MKTIIFLLTGLLLFTGCSNKPQVVIVTSQGTIELELDGDAAPKHTANFVKLVEEQFFVGTTFHRVEPGFVIQGGDPNSKDSDRTNDGRGGPDYRIDAEIGLKHLYGSIGAARLPDRVNPEKQSNASQFYICLKDLPGLDRGGYTVFGKVVAGMDIVEKISRVPADNYNNPVNPVIMERVYVK